MSDPLQDLARQMAAMNIKLDAVLQGTHDPNGSWHPGLAPTVADHARRLILLELAAVTALGAQEAAELRQLNWRHALALSLTGGVIGQGINWLKDHIK